MTASFIISDSLPQADAARQHVSKTFRQWATQHGYDQAVLILERVVTSAESKNHPAIAAAAELLARIKGSAESGQLYLISESDMPALPHGSVERIFCAPDATQHARRLAERTGAKVVTTKALAARGKDEDAESYAERQRSFLQAAREESQAGQSLVVLTKYSPDEPRAPAGSSEGGEWTSGGGGGSSSSDSGSSSSGSGGPSRDPSKETLLAFRDLSNSYFRQIQQLNSTPFNGNTPGERATARQQAVDAVQAQKNEAERQFFNSLSSQPLQPSSLMHAGESFKEVTPGHFLMLHPGGYVTGPVDAATLRETTFHGPIPGYDPPEDVAKQQAFRQQVTQEITSSWANEPAAQKALAKEYGGLDELFHQLALPEKQVVLRGQQVVAKEINDQWSVVGDPKSGKYSVQANSKLKPAKSFLPLVRKAQGQNLDAQGGELPQINPAMLAKMDFITYGEDIEEGSNCSSCRFNEQINGQHQCTFQDEKAGIDGRGQPVNARNCCAFWDRPGTARNWQQPGQAVPVQKAMGQGSEPDSLIELKDIRQEDNYSCGAAATMAVGQYFGVGPATLEEWKAALGTNVKTSTRPQAIIDYLTSLGLQVEARQDMSIDDLRENWRRGFCTICPIQEYGVPSKQASYLYGHWVVCIGAALGYVFVQDPSIDNALGKPGGDVTADQEDMATDQAPGRMLIDEATWLRVWHDSDADHNKYTQYGIIVGPPLGMLDNSISKEFNPDEARDDHGRWTSGGSSGSSSSSKPTSSKPSSKPAKKPAASSASSAHPGAAHGSTVKVTLTKQRAAPRDANGKITPVSIKTQLTKQETGRIGEAAISAYLRDVVGIQDTVALNAGKANESIDLFGDSMAPEIKTGLASNSKKAQQWRITFSMELSKAAKAQYDAMSPKQQKAWREQQQRNALQRKLDLLKQLSKERGHKINPVTFTGILNPDTRTVDIYKTDGYHQRIDWNDPKAQYVASVQYDSPD